LLSALADNGGPTHTCAIPRSSPCRDAGIWEGAPEDDQRGYNRRGIPDMGAFEYQGVTASWDGSDNRFWDNAANWDINEIPLMCDDVIIPNVSTDYPYLRYDADAYNLTVESGVDMTLSAGGSLITYGSITNNDGIRSVCGISDGQWHLIASPITDATANIFLDKYLQSWDETTTTWNDINNPATALNPLQGYGLWSDAAKTTYYNFSGTPNTGNQSIAITYTEEAGKDDTYFGANLLGNPYPSAIDWSGLDDTWGAVHYWNGTAYVSWNDGSGDGSQFVPARQGFFIVATEAGTFELSNANRVHNDQAFYKDAKSNSLVLETVSKDYADKLYLNFDYMYTNNTTCLILRKCKKI